MRNAVFPLMLISGLYAQDGQQTSRPGWPCVPGRAADPAYLETSESSGGQLFLFQKGEVEHASLVMSASFTHPSTVLRAVGHLSGSRDFEFPVDSTIESMQIMVSLQCHNAIQVSRPNGSEMTTANSAINADLQAGRILRVDRPEPGKWKIHLAGSGLFILSVGAKTPIKLTDVTFFEAHRDGTESGTAARIMEPRLGIRQDLEANLAGQVSNVKVQFENATGDLIAGVESTESASEHLFRAKVTPGEERFRVFVSGSDAAGWPVLRTYPNLFRAERTK
jgi:hypothetical protein